MKRFAMLTVLVALLATTPARAEPVQVRFQWVGNDLTGGVLASRVRGLIAASTDKRETTADLDGLAVIVQTIDPAAEWQDKVAAQKRLTVYSITINRHAAGSGADVFASTALGYCALSDLATCAREIVDAIDEQIGRAGLR